MSRQGNLRPDAASRTSAKPGLLARFCHDESGVFAVVFGILAIVLIAMGGAVVDYVTLQQARTRAQTALDAATLALQPAINDLKETDDSIRQKAEAFVLERLGTSQIRNAKIDKVIIDRDKGELTLSGQFAVETIFVKLVGVDELHADVTSQATKGVANVEVAVALDVTGSMSTELPSGHTRLKALKEATSTLVDTILKLNTSENYAKVALVPYAQSVNVGEYADAIRGPIRPKRVIENISWNTGGNKAIAKISNAQTPVFTANGHGLKAEDYVFVRNTGNSAYDNKIFRVVTANPNTFTLSNAARTTYEISNRGTFAKCLRSDCKAVFTSTAHGYAEGETIWIEGAQGLTSFNKAYHQIVDVTANAFTVKGTDPDRTQTYTSNSGQFWCRWQTASVGCIEYEFTDLDRKPRVQAISTCVTERTTRAATDAPPSAVLMGRNYPYIESRPDYSNTCTTSKITPLTRNESELKNAINGLSASGSTSGSLGILWSWYMLAPNFGYLWPNSAPAPYRTQNLMKAVIIMTDGEFNTVHYNGVVSGISSLTGSGNNERINQASPNGDPFKQAAAYCAALKNETGIIVFTVGFGITKDSTTDKQLANCASGSDKHFLAEDAAGLEKTFRDIADQITALRLTR